MSYRKINAFTLLGEKSFVICTSSQTAASSAEGGVENTMSPGLTITPLQSVLLFVKSCRGSHCIFSPDWLSSKGRRVRSSWMVHYYKRALPWVKPWVLSPEKPEEQLWTLSLCCGSWLSMPRSFERIRYFMDHKISNFVFTWINTTYNKLAVNWQKDVCKLVTTEKWSRHPPVISWNPTSTN